jgi:N-acetylneuraminate synthase
VGLSDHSGKIFPGLSAATLGANMVELHVVFSKECFGPDVHSSVTIDELRQLVEGIRFIDRALANPVDKDAMASELSELRTMFGKSVVVVRDLSAGHSLTSSDLTVKKPGTGVPAARLTEMVGRKLACPVVANTLLREEDLQ